MAHTTVTSVQLLTPAQRATMSPTGDIVYIGMPGKAAAAYGITDIGPFGKPWACLKDPRGWQTAYREYLYARIKTDADFALAVRDLHGKTLVCWCKSKGANCHGDILSAAAEWLFHGIEAMASCPRCGHDRHRNRECVDEHNQPRFCSCDERAWEYDDLATCDYCSYQGAWPCPSHSR